MRWLGLALAGLLLLGSCTREAHPMPLLPALLNGYDRQIKDQCDTQPELDWCLHAGS